MTPAPGQNFESMLAKHGSFVRGVARSLVFDEQSAEDVAQDTWLAALEHPPRREAGIRAWLGKVTRHFSFRVGRSVRRRAAREQAAAKPEVAARKAADPVEATLLKEMIEAVLLLQEPYRSTVLLRYYENLDPCEIAERANIPAATVRTRLKRALDQLREHFDATHGNRSAWTASLFPLAAGALKPAALAAAAAGGGVAAATTSTTGFALGGILMAKKVVVAASVTLALAAAVSVAVVIAKRPDGDSGQTRPAPIEIADARQILPTLPPSEPVRPAGGIAPRPYVPGDDDRAPAETPLVAKGAPHATLSGRVVDQKGAPQAGVLVTVRLLQMSQQPDTPMTTEVSNERKVSSRTGADGRFTFDDLPIDTDVTVRAKPDVLCDVSRTIVVAKPGPLDLGDLVARTGGSVSGTVLGPHGTAVKGCQVRAWPVTGDNPGFAMIRLSRFADDDTRSAVTASNGQYRIDGLPEGECAVSVSPDDHPDEGRTGVRVRKGEITWEIDFKLIAGTALAGIVRGPSGEPIAGATVAATQAELKLDDPAGLPMRTRTVTTGQDGRFSIQGLRQEPFNVRARKSGFVAASSDNALPGNDLALQLKASGVAFGRVKNVISSAPVKDFSIRVQNEGFSQGATRARVLRGAEAARAAGVDEAPELFAIVDMPEAPVRLSIHADEFADEEIGDVRAAAGDKTEVKALLTPQAIVRGLVTDPNGNPIAGARVTASTGRPDAEQRGPTGNFRIRRRTVAKRESPGAPDAPELARSAVTGADGTFAIKALPGGDYKVSAVHGSFAESAGVDLVLKPADVIEGVRLVLEAGGTFAGRVLDADGNPFPGGRVNLRKKGAAYLPPGIPGGREPAIAGATGEFEVTGLNAGEYLASLADHSGGGGFESAIIIADDEARPDDVPITIESGKTTRKDFQLKARASLSGIVKEGGKPASGVKVSLTPKGTDSMFAQSAVKTDEQGAFTIDKVAPGDYVAYVEPPGAPLPVKRPVSLAPRADQRITVDLPTGAIEGRVLDRTTNKPLAGVTISVAPDKPPEETTRVMRAVMIAATPDGESGGIQTFSIGGATAPVQTDSDGRYRLKYLDAGKYKVSIRGQDVMPQSRSAVVVEEGRTTKDQDFGAAKGASLLITVDAAGHDGASVFAFVSKGGSDDDLEPKHGSTKGPIRFSGLEAGRYHVRIDAVMTGLEGSADVDVVAGQEARVTVRLTERQ